MRESQKDCRTTPNIDESDRHGRCRQCPSITAGISGSRVDARYIGYYHDSDGREAPRDRDKEINRLAEDSNRLTDYQEVESAADAETSGDSKAIAFLAKTRSTINRANVETATDAIIGTNSMSKLQRVRAARINVAGTLLINAHAT